MFHRKPRSNKTTAGRQRPSRLAAERPSAFSYYARRSDELLNTGRQIARSETAEQARAASRFWRQRLGLGVLLLTSLICLGYISTLSTQPRIVVADASAGPGSKNTAQYETAAAEILSSSVFNQNKITISTTALAQRLAARFPELATVSVSLPLLTHRPVITITNNQPVLLLATADGSYALDSNGTALLTGAALSAVSDLHLPLITDESTVKAVVRQQALTADNVHFILTVVAQLKARHLAVDSLTLPAAASELDIRLAGQPYYVKFNLASNSSLQQLGTLLAVYDRLHDQQITPGQYIDVRVDGRAYYK